MGRRRRSACVTTVPMRCRVDQRRNLRAIARETLQEPMFMFATGGPVKRAGLKIAGFASAEYTED